MSPPDAFMRDINAQKNVSAPLLGRVMHLWASLPRDEWRDFDRVSFRTRLTELTAARGHG